MTRWPFPLTLCLIMFLGGGCGADTSLEHPPAQAAPVNADEAEAIAALQELGAKIDLDEAGHARIVEFVDSKVRDDDLKLLAKFPRLEACDITGGKVTEAGLKHLRGLTGLQRLYLHDLPVTSDGLASLADLVKLDVLSLRNTKVDDQGMKHLKKLTQLTVLNLSKTAITNDALKELGSLKKLDTLVLADTAATGEGFAHLSPLQKLRTLNMDRCEDIEGYMMDLSGLPELRMLYVKGCTVLEDEIDELVDYNPRLAVFDD